ncbi:MAG: dienelactone hydrolase [Pirellulaceae bacterium]|nr:dienelactone hydrolase [Pirellulaceae bacterium]
MNPKSLIISWAWLAFMFIASQADSGWAQYDPLKTTFTAEIIDTRFTYGVTKRAVPLRIFLPNTDKPASVILFSHGLGGSREASPFLARQWSGRGYCVVFLQHAGSDRDVIKNAPRFQKRTALRNAANGESAKQRISDVHATLDQLEQLNRAPGQLHNRLDLNRIGMSGHSFGAITTQAVSGQRYALQEQPSTDTRIKAAIAMSPSMPLASRKSKPFAMVKIPWLLMTGTDDDSPVNRRVDAASRRKVFKALPADGHSFELVLNEGTHFIFSGRNNQRAVSQKSNQQKESIKAISTAFWDAYLKQDTSAKLWLKSDAVKTVLDRQDEWLTK